MGRHIPFARFGARFLEALLTTELIESQLRAAIPPRIYIDETKPLPAEGRVSFVGVGAIEREVGEDEIRMTAQIRLSLDVTLPTGRLPTVGVLLPLHIDFRTYDRLILYADAWFDRDAVVFDYKGWNPIDLGIIELGLKWQFFLQAEAAIALSLPGRVIDVEAVLLEMPSSSLLDPEDDSGQTVRMGRHRTALLPRDRVAVTTLEPGQHVAPYVVLREGERIQLQVYGMCEHVPTTSAPGASLGLALRMHRGRSWLHTAGADLTDAWGGHWQVLTAGGWFTAPKSAYYQLRIDNPSGAAARVKVRQRREWPDGLTSADRRIGFAEFGHNLLTLGLGAPFLTQQLAVLLARSAPGLRFPWTDSPVGPVEVTVRPGLREVAEVLSDDPSAVAVRKIVLRGTLAVARKGRRLAALPVDLGLLVSLRTTEDPVAVEATLDSVSHLALDTGPFRALTDTAARVVGALLATGVAKTAEGRLVDLVMLLLGRAGSVLQTEQIPDVAAGLAAATAPIAVAPQPVFDGVRHTGQTLVGGQSRSHPITLARTKPVTVVARLRTSDAPGDWRGYCTLAVCDDQDGVLATKDVSLGPGSPTGRLKIKFRAPLDGEYHVRVRVHPHDEEYWRIVSYDLDVRGDVAAAMIQTAAAVPNLLRR